MSRRKCCCGLPCANCSGGTKGEIAITVAGVTGANNPPVYGCFSEPTITDANHFVAAYVNHVIAADETGLVIPTCTSPPQSHTECDGGGLNSGVPTNCWWSSACIGCLDMNFAGYFWLSCMIVGPGTTTCDDILVPAGKYYVDVFCWVYYQFSEEIGVRAIFRTIYTGVPSCSTINGSSPAFLSQAYDDPFGTGNKAADFSGATVTINFLP